MNSTDDRVVLRAGAAALTVDPAAGARLASLVVDGHELLLTEGDGPIWWGAYPMVPFAGRIGEGRFTFRGRSYQLPINMAPHAIHGTVFDRPWQVTTRTAQAATFDIDLGPVWPFRGRVRHDIRLTADGLEATLTLDADEPMPAWMGWHPWFRREVDGAALELSFEAARMFVRRPDMLPTGALTSPGPHPWDDAFTDLLAPPRLRWPGVLDLEIRSDAVFWVVFDERSDGMCVEPQTAPPDAIRLAAMDAAEPPLATPGAPARVSMTWRWSAPTDEAGAGG
jgi:galactose mutarotase-like enzyme